MESDTESEYSEPDGDPELFNAFAAAVISKDPAAFAAFRHEHTNQLNNPRDGGKHPNARDVTKPRRSGPPHAPHNIPHVSTKAKQCPGLKFKRKTQDAHKASQAKNDVICHKCSGKGHYRDQCPSRDDVMTANAHVRLANKNNILAAVVDEMDDSDIDDHPASSNAASDSDSESEPHAFACIEVPSLNHDSAHRVAMQSQVAMRKSKKSNSPKRMLYTSDNAMPEFLTDNSSDSDMSACSDMPTPAPSSDDKSISDKGDPESARASLHSSNDTTILDDKAALSHQVEVLCVNNLAQLSLGVDHLIGPDDDDSITGEILDSSDTSSDLYWVPDVAGDNLAQPSPDDDVSITFSCDSLWTATATATMDARFSTLPTLPNLTQLAQPSPDDDVSITFSCDSSYTSNDDVSTTFSCDSSYTPKEEIDDDWHNHFQYSDDSGGETNFNLNQYGTPHYVSNVTPPHTDDSDVTFDSDVTPPITFRPEPDITISAQLRSAQVRDIAIPQVRSCPISAELGHWDDVDDIETDDDDTDLVLATPSPTVILNFSEASTPAPPPPTNIVRPSPPRTPDIILFSCEQNGHISPQSRADPISTKNSFSELTGNVHPLVQLDLLIHHHSQSSPHPEPHRAQFHSRGRKRAVKPRAPVIAPWYVPVLREIAAFLTWEFVKPSHQRTSSVPAGRPTRPPSQTAPWTPDLTSTSFVTPRTDAVPPVSLHMVPISDAAPYIRLSLILCLALLSNCPDTSARTITRPPLTDTTTPVLDAQLHSQGEILQIQHLYQVAQSGPSVSDSVTDAADVSADNSVATAQDAQLNAVQALLNNMDILQIQHLYQVAQSGPSFFDARQW